MYKGMNIVRGIFTGQAYQIAENAGFMAKGVERQLTENGNGFNMKNGTFVDMFKEALLTQQSYTQRHTKRCFN